jgi:hypothetical protein
MYKYTAILHIFETRHDLALFFILLERAVFVD